MQEELEDQNFVIIAAAQDTEGWAAAGEWYDRAEPTYVALVDVQHRVSSLYNLVNVPSAVWVDEQGQVVRINEGTYTQTYNFGDLSFGTDQYAPAVRDWAMNGADSKFVWTPEEVTGKIRSRSSNEELAEPNFKLGVYFHEAGDETLANTYWERAEELFPDSWNYARQDWSFTPEEAGANWSAKFDGLGDRPYYAPLDLQSETDGR